MRDLVAEQAAADAEYTRTVLPVLADYLLLCSDDVDFDRLRRVALKGRSANQLALIDALVAARAAAARVGSDDMAAVSAAGDDGWVFAIVANAINRIANGPDVAFVQLETREAMAKAVLDALAAKGYAITHLGGAA